jgi:hypothetical protein
VARLDRRDAASFAANLAAFNRSLGPVQVVLRDIRRA